ncbi:MAG TPA: hypothetical protein VK656_04465, partial [Candidatus Acidoferrum sp.]|nr:hypothetical protein [Candidatus Acidoferrum sp.]
AHATPRPTPKPTPKPTTPPSPSAIVVKTASTSLGKVLTDPDGLTLYIHAGDTATQSTCTGGCATSWPPLIVKAGGSAVGGSGVTGHFSTLTRADGSIQIAYNGHPLYGWVGDSQRGDVTGQDIAGFTVAKP